MAKRAELMCAGPGNLYQKYNEWITEINPEVVLFIKLTARTKKLHEMGETERARIAAFNRKFKGGEIRFVPHRLSRVQNSLCVWEGDKAKWMCLSARSSGDNTLTYPVTYWYAKHPKAFSKLLESEEKARELKSKEIYDWIKPRSPRKTAWIDGGEIDI